MWVARFKLKDDEDIYSPLCKKYRIEFFVFPYTNFIKNKKINLVIGGTISSNEQNKREFLNELKKDKRIKTIEIYKNYILVHAQHPTLRESRAEIRIFYNPEYIITKPVHISSDGWEYWEVACLERNPLNKIIDVVTKKYSGELFSVKKEKIKSITSLKLAPDLTEKQLEALKIAYKSGYYNYPRSLTIPELASSIKRSYSTFQENLRKAENKILEHFLQYR